MARTISFLATKRLPQLGQLDKKEKYSVILVLFQLCEQERHFISKSTHHPINKKPRYLAEDVNLLFIGIANLL